MSSSSAPSITGIDVEAAAGVGVKSGSAWLAARTNERVIAQQAIASDPKYKKYTQQVEKCLASFDSVHEWADFIAFLKQLRKTFESYTQFKEIPKKLIVAKRLAQCLNPALPTGVHQRALECYAHILSVLGSEGLRRDLALWSSGLFPFFEYAATSVKPTLLDLFDTYYLPLQANLRPIMKSFILALLPGLEEEAGEFFESVLRLLDKLSGMVSPSYLFQNIWLVMLTTPSARGTALNFLSRRLPKLNVDEDITSVVGNDIGLMIRAFAAALDDDNLLVRRGALDLLLQSIRVDSLAMRKAQADDRTIIMRAATSVVLRRDLSLNRRLYTWLLGPDERSEKQVAYLKEHALTLLKETLKEEMDSPSTEYPESRPFKIFISLLDKWEVGSLLTDALIVDTLRAIKRHLDSSIEAKDDILTTASTLYEAVEPAIVWKQLLSLVFKEITSDNPYIEAMWMIRFLLKHFVHDEEILTIHFPIILGGCVDLIDIHTSRNPTALSSPPIQECLKLQEALLQMIPAAALIKPPEVSPIVQANRESQRPYHFACTFYGIKPESETVAEGSSRTPLVTVCESFLAFSTRCLSLSSAEKPLFARETYPQILHFLSICLRKLNAPIKLSWDPKPWLMTVLQTFNYPQFTSFTAIDCTVSLAIALHQTPYVQPKLQLEGRATIAKMIKSLLGYLDPQWSVYHLRAVNLVWELEKATGKNHVESVVAQTLAVSRLDEKHIAFEAFGVLWRLTEDNVLPGFRLKVPMMIVLESLNSEDLHVKRIGETWMRCCLKAYSRVLDPILFDLLDPSIRRIPSTLKVRGRELQAFVYERPFDQRYIGHLLQLMLAITQFGGQGFAKTARNAHIRRSVHPRLVQRVEAAGLAEPEVTYLEVIVDSLLRILQSEPKDAYNVEMQTLNTYSQSTTIDLLQALIARGEIEHTLVEGIELALVPKLFLCIHSKQLDLQNKMLHLLHSLISAMTTFEVNSLTTTPRQVNGSVEEIGGETAIQYSIHPLLVQTLIDGISVPSNHSVLQHWIDFILMAIPQFQPTLQPVIAPLQDCICRQLLSSLSEIHKASTSSLDFTQDVATSVTDADFVMLLNALERLVLLSLAHTMEASSAEDEMATLEKSASESSGLLGYVSNVFGSETPQPQQDEQLTARSVGYRSLHDGVRVLFLVWSTLGWTSPAVAAPKDETLAMIYGRTRTRCRRVLEHLFRMQSAEVFESIIDWWSRDLGLTVPTNAAFELVDVLMASAQNAVHMLCESISSRLPGLSEKSRKVVTNPDLSDAVLFKFMEQYMKRLDAPLALQVWPRFLQLVKDIIATTKDFKVQAFYALRCLAALAENITQTTAVEDRRIRKDLQDNFAKLLDSCVVYIGRSDQGFWLRRGTKDAFPNGRESPAPRAEEKMDASVAPLLPSTNSSRTLNSTDLVTQVNHFISSVALPNMRRFLMDNDKITNSCTNIVYYIVAPSMRSRTKPTDVDETSVAILQEMTRLPNTLKTWKTPVSELLNDNRLFNCTADSANKWRPIIKALFDSDKTALPELLAKFSTAPSANIFANKEYEMLQRSLNVRRLSFALFTGDKNQFLTQLPMIQEKLVDILRNVPAPIVQSEVFLCIRVLLCRLSAHNLTSLWPVILTELYRIFEQVLLSIPPDASEELQLVLAASKCLDLLLTLQTEEFQVHQWMFITDTVDAVYKPDGWLPEALIDQLAKVIDSVPITETKANMLQDSLMDSPNTSFSIRHTRKPMLNSIRQIDSVRDLMTFFTSVSITTYESVYGSGGNIDWAAVERDLMCDMFDGK